MVEIESVQRGGETVRVAFAANFSVGDYVETSRFLLADRQHCGIILRVSQQVSDAVTVVTNFASALKK